MKNRYFIFSFLVALSTAPFLEAAQPSDPGIGYVFPPGANAGTTVEVRLGGFNWTPDLEFFVHDERVKLDVNGKLSRMFLPGAPYLIGTKAYFPPPMPREVTATLSIPADMPPGPIRWQVANANGASKSGVFIVSNRYEIIEDADVKLQRIQQFPAVISGRLERHEEIDRYVIRTERKTPVTLDVAARRLGGEFNVVIEVRDDSGRLVADAADTRGRDTALTFIAEANRDYTVSLCELDFRGNRAYVYRLSIETQPRVVAISPSGGRSGEERRMQVFGFGLDGENSGLSHLIEKITFPNEGAVWSYRGGFPLKLSGHAELQNPDVRTTFEIPELPAAVTTIFDGTGNPHRVRFHATKGETWAIRGLARCDHLSLDLNLTLYDADGKQLAENDDLPETTDAGLLWTVPADGDYELAIADSSGSIQTDGAVSRLEIVRPKPDFRLRVPEKHNVVQGGKAELTVKVIREDGFAAPIPLAITGLPAGVSVPDELIIPGDKSELKIALSAAADVPARASLVTVTGTVKVDGREIIRKAATITPSGTSKKMLVAVTMKPRIEISPIESDERTVHRGTTHLAPIETKRLEGFTAPATLQIDSTQSFKYRQGLLAPDVIVPAGAESVFFPTFVPQVCETLDAYRMLVIAVAPVPDVDGRIRYLVSRMPAPDNSIAITVEGALLKIAPIVAVEKMRIHPGEPFVIPMRISRSAKLNSTVRLEAFLADAPEEKWAGVDVAADQATVDLRIVSPSNIGGAGLRKLVVRAKVLQPADLPQLDEKAQATPMSPELIAILRSGYLPVIADAEIEIDVHK